MKEIDEIKVILDNNFKPPYVSKEYSAFKKFAAAQLQALMDERVEGILKEMKIIILQAIADEPEYPGNMPDELWEELDNKRENVEKAMQGTVRLTKNGITDRFLEALKSKIKEGGAEETLDEKSAFSRHVFAQEENNDS